jgi:PAS domain S-box-containing protein
MHPSTTPTTEPGDVAAAQLLAAIVDSSDDAIFSFGLDGTIWSWNAGAEQLLGYSAPEIVGSNVSQLIPAGLMVEAEQMEADVLAGERAAHRDTVRLHANGEAIEAAFALSPMREDAGAVIGFSAIGRGIDERRSLERERDDLLAELRRSNTDLEQFAAVASHDLSEPLRAIVGMLQLLERHLGEELDDQAKDLMERTVNATVRMRRLIDDLLRYSRLGRGVPALTRVSLVEVVDRVTATLQSMVDDSAATLNYGDLPIVMGDKQGLEHVFQNLIANAMKFRGSAAPVVQITAKQQPDGWHLSVADNGIGIRPQHAGRVFELFKRLHSRDAYEGTGIGLAICARLVTRWGGRIWVEPQEGPGTMVTFTVPEGRTS